MSGGGEDRIMSPYVAREVGLVETKSMARRVEVRMGGFHLSDGHRDCCPFHCAVSRLHFSARKSAESDGIILNSTERLAQESPS